MSFYDDMAAVATDLLTKFGQPITLRRNVGASVDPVTGAVTSGTSDDQATVGVLRIYPAKLVDGTRIQAGDRELVIDASVQPLMTDKPVLGGMDWTIVAIETASPAGIPLVYFIQVRR